MAACGSLQHIFENPLPENPSLLESLSITDLFGKIHFEESPEVSPPPSLSWSASSSSNDQILDHKKDGFWLMNSESLQLCTEGLGFESLDDLEDLKNASSNSKSSSIMSTKNAPVIGHSTSYMGSEQYKRAKSCMRSFPPPLSSLGRIGRPSVCFRSYRQDGRFILQEVRIPTHEYLHASREDGRLKLSIVQMDDDGDEIFLEKEGREGDGKGEEDNQVEENDCHHDDEGH